MVARTSVLTRRASGRYRLSFGRHHTPTPVRKRRQVSLVEHRGYVTADDGVTESVRFPVSPGAILDASQCSPQTGVKKVVWKLRRIARELPGRRRQHHAAKSAEWDIRSTCAPRLLFEVNSLLLPHHVGCQTTHSVDLRLLWSICRLVVSCACPRSKPRVRR